MWDSLRSKYKGEDCCAGIICIDCPFNEKVCSAGTAIRNAYENPTIINAYEAIDLVENWAKEHPIVTNAEKFKEVFGFEPFTNNCINGEVKCDKCECYDYGVCNASRFWDAEYMPPTKEGE